MPFAGTILISTLIVWFSRLCHSLFFQQLAQMCLPLQQLHYYSCLLVEWCLMFTCMQFKYSKMCAECNCISVTKERRGSCPALSTCRFRDTFTLTALPWVLGSVEHLCIFLNYLVSVYSLTAVSSHFLLVMTIL